MTIYIALLRGINVSGKNIIKMAELRQVLETLGLRRVKTYIQSGNVVFESNEEAEKLQSNIEQEIKRVFTLTVPVMVRTAEELKRVIEECPFAPGSLAEGETLHVSFLATAPTQAEMDNLPDVTGEVDEYRIIGKEIYLMLRNSFHTSKLPNKLQKIGVPATVRNWKTVTKLATMAQEMEG